MNSTLTEYVERLVADAETMAVRRGRTRSETGPNLYGQRDARAENSSDRGNPLTRRNTRSGIESGHCRTLSSTKAGEG